MLNRNATAYITTGGHLAIIVKTATVKPGISIIGQFVYWGPMFLLLVMNWKTTSRSIQRLGIGPIVATAVAALFAIDSEARHLLNLYPMVLMVCIKSIESRVRGKLLCWFLIPVSFATSLFWFRINVASFVDHPLAFPDQRYFMTQGPWMSDKSYLTQVAIAVAVGLNHLCHDVRQNADFGRGRP